MGGGVTGSGSDHITEIGERALQETREYREQQRRLADIEQELANLSTAVQSEVICLPLYNLRYNE